MEFSVLRNRLRQHVTQHGSPATLVLFTYSFYPPDVIRLLRHARIPPSRVVVFYQRWSYAPHGGKPSSVRRETVREYTDLCHRHRVTLFRWIMNMTDRVQMHLKVALLFYPDRVTYVQYSHNWNYTRSVLGDVTEMNYIGRPRGLKTLLRGLRRDLIRIPDRFVRESGRQSLRGILHLFRSTPVPEDDDDTCRVLLQTHKASFLPQLDMALRSLPEVTGPSELLLHFPYVNATSHTHFCQTVVRPFCTSHEQLQSTSVLLGMARSEQEAGFLHESWVARVQKRNLCWFFLTSSNLTMPSWGPRAANYEVGVLCTPEGIVDTRDPQTQVLLHVRRALQGSLHTRVVPITCTTIDPTSAPREDLPTILGRAPCTRIDYPPPKPDMTTEDLYTRGRDMLLNNLLVGLLGTHDLLFHPEMRGNMYARLALYQYLFHDLGRAQPVRPVGGLHKDEVVANFISALRRLPREDLPRWMGCTQAPTTIQVLADVFVKWSTVFDLFDPSITRLRPVVSMDTIVGANEVPPGSILLTEAPGIDGSPPGHQSAYHSLTFLLQHLHATGTYAWWRCSQGHRFFFPVGTLLTSSNPDCLVCPKSLDIVGVYDAVSRVPGVELLTVEYPLYRRGRRRDGPGIPADVDDPEEEDGDEEADAGPVQAKTRMAWDLFFVLDRKQLCAIEFDDASHLVGPLAEEGIDYLQTTNDPPHRDAVKNVVASCMGIHLLRILALQKRQNASAKIEAIVHHFIELVRACPQNSVNTRPAPSPATLQRYWKNRLRVYGPNTRLRMKDLLVDQRDRVGRFLYPEDMDEDVTELAPISIICAIQVPGTGNRDLNVEMMRRMIGEGADTHPGIVRSKGPVLLDHHVDDSSLLHNAAVLSRYLGARITGRTIRRGNLHGRVIYDVGQRRISPRLIVSAERVTGRGIWALGIQALFPRTSFPTTSTLWVPTTDVCDLVRKAETGICRLVTPEMRYAMGNPSSLPDCREEDKRELRDAQVRGWPASVKLGSIVYVKPESSPGPRRWFTLEEVRGSSTEGWELVLRGAARNSRHTIPSSNAEFQRIAVALPKGPQMLRTLLPARQQGRRRRK